MFIYMASKASGQNLISYFAKWGLHAEADTIEKVNKLQLPEPKMKYGYREIVIRFVKNK